MSDEGYTLAEMLAALLVVGLAIGGLTQALRVVGLAERGASETLGEQRALRAGQQGLTKLLERSGPFRSTESNFRGDAAGFEFRCDGGRMCGARLSPEAQSARLVLINGAEAERIVELPVPEDARFSYQTWDRTVDSWPPEGPEQTLRSVRLTHEVGGAERAVATARIWTEQPAECAFDAIAHDCRESAP